MDFSASWHRCWQQFGGNAEATLMQQLLAAYAEQQRSYHTQQHLQDCLSLFERYQQLAQHPAEVELALWFHDAVYDVRGADNEAKSADWAMCELRAQQVGEALVGRVQELIMATCHNGLPNGQDQALLVDIDLSILGAEPTRFAAYEQQIRQEYAWVPEALFQQKRAEILTAFLQRDRLYLTPPLYDRFETQARANLTRALARLAVTSS